jgi:hypothetical protein
MPDHRYRPRVIVLGDLVVDVVLAPATELVTGTDVPGRVMLRQADRPRPRPAGSAEAGPG